jgi:small-conductance mechanosensitive channel
MDRSFPPLKIAHKSNPARGWPVEFDLSAQPEIVQQAAGIALWAYDIAKGWLVSPAAWSQLALLVLAYLLAVLVTRRTRPRRACLLDPVPTRLSEAVISLGNISFSVMSIVRGLIAGSVLFWLGRWSNEQSVQFIQKQAEMRPSIRQLMSKTVEFTIFGVAFLLLTDIMGINLSPLAVIGGAIGFGLQKVASNFISAVILLVEGQATVGDHVEPETPDTEIRCFGESGIDTAVEFWCNGLNRFTADVYMIVWKALKAAGIEISFPQRVVELRSASAQAGA